MRKWNSVRSRFERREIINAHCEWLLTGWRSGAELYLVTVMYEALGGLPPHQLRHMEVTFEELYGRTLTRLVRNPRRTPSAALPLVIYSPDLACREPREVTQRNGGLHQHAVVMVSGDGAYRTTFRDALSRAGTVMARKGAIARVHVVMVTYDLSRVIRYICKALYRQGLDLEHIGYLPKAPSELSWRQGTRGVHHHARWRSPEPEPLRLTLRR